LPANWEFTCNATSHTITRLDQISWKLYGQEGNSTWSGQQILFYNNQLSRLFIPLNAAPSSFEVKECLSPFHTISGKAPVVQSWWGISAATLDVNNPLEAAGNGALILLTGKVINMHTCRTASNETVLISPFYYWNPAAWALPI
jgi:hypothetical protein